MRKRRYGFQVSAVERSIDICTGLATDLRCLLATSMVYRHMQSI